MEGNGYGTYGGNNRIVSFSYQAVFTTGTTSAQVNVNILPELEREIVSGILPDFFACPESSPTGLISGISPSDPDSLSIGGR